MSTDDNDPAVFIISGIPVDDEVNRAYAKSLVRSGTEPPPFPRPYKDSVVFTCEHCDGRVNIGPRSVAARLDYLARGLDPIIMCLMCVAVMTKEDKLDVSIVQLTNQTSDESWQ
jgi:hypothetical protein